MDRAEVEDALMRLGMKGLVIKHERKNFTGKEEYYELAKEIADKVGVIKRTGLFGTGTQVSAPVKQLKDIKEVLGRARELVEKGDLVGTLDCFDQLVNPARHGSAMVEQFFDEHRDLRLYKIRLQDRGQQYLNAHTSELVDLITRIDGKVRNGPVSQK
jgi:ribosomal protein S28E/S33